MKIFRIGLDTFGDKEKFRRWLCKPNISLGGAVPQKLMNEEGGYTQVLNCLYRIEYGNY